MDTVKSKYNKYFRFDGKIHPSWWRTECGPIRHRVGNLWFKAWGLEGYFPSLALFSFILFVLRFSYKVSLVLVSNLG